METPRRARAEGKASLTPSAQILAYMQDAFKEDTRKSYSSHVGMFRKFWKETKQRGQPFPLQESKLLEFAIYLDQVRGILHTSAAQYISAVRAHNTFFLQPGKEQIKSVLKGMANRNAAKRRGVPLKPTWSAETVIKATEKLHALLNAKQPSLADIQSILISILGFVFALRASSLASLRLKDLQVVGNNITLTLHTYKTKGVRDEVQFTVPWRACKPLQAVRQFLLKAKQFCFSNNSYLIPPHEGASRPSVQVSRALRRVCELLKLPVPVGNQSHALRRGAASAMISAGVASPRIQSWGMWGSEHAMKPYIEQSTWQESSEFLEPIFGWMCGKLTSGVGIRRTDR